MSEWKVLFEESFWESAREEDPAFEVGMEIERPIPTVEHPENHTRCISITLRKMSFRKNIWSRWTDLGVCCGKGKV